MTNLFFYLFVASVVLVYGIGLDRVVLYENNFKELLLNSVQILGITLISTIIVKVFAIFLLKSSLKELIPFMTLAMVLASYIVLNIILEKEVNELNSIIVMSFLFTLFAVTESLTILDSIIIDFSCILSMLLLQCFLIVLKNRYIIAKPPKLIYKTSLVYINIAILMIAIFFWNISWLNPNVIK